MEFGIGIGMSEHVEDSDVARALAAFGSPPVKYRVFPHRPVPNVPLYHAVHEEMAVPAVVIAAAAVVEAVAVSEPEIAPVVAVEPIPEPPEELVASPAVDEPILPPAVHSAPEPKPEPEPSQVAAAPEPVVRQAPQPMPVFGMFRPVPAAPAESNPAPGEKAVPADAPAPSLALRDVFRRL
jgi:hypothetical protein